MNVSKIRIFIVFKVRKIIPGSVAVAGGFHYKNLRQNQCTEYFEETCSHLQGIKNPEQNGPGFFVNYFLLSRSQPFQVGFA